MEKGKRTIEEIIDDYGNEKENLIPVLQGLQRERGYISPEAVLAVSEKLKITENKIFGVASFYSQFKFFEPGEHQIQVCLGTACHVKGGENLLSVINDEIGIVPGETTEDMKFSLERVACLGCCALAPTVVIDGEVYGKMDKNKLKQLLDEYRGD